MIFRRYENSFKLPMRVNIATRLCGQEEVEEEEVLMGTSSRFFLMPSTLLTFVSRTVKYI